MTRARAPSFPPYADQVFYGTFSVVGGEGRYGRLRGSGTFLSIQPSVRGRSSAGTKLHLEGHFKHVSQARHGGLSKACKDSTKPFPPPPTGSASVSLAGLAFAPAGSSGTLPSGTTVYPSGATVTGATGCGQPIYAVFTYSGPGSAAVSGQADTSSGTDVKLGDTVYATKTALLALPGAGATDHVEVSVLVTTPDHVEHNYTATLDLNRNC